MAKSNKNRKKPLDVIDKYVGSRIYMQRKTLGISQPKLAKALRISFQQVQKYENGTNRIGAGRLQQVAHILKVPVTFFFDGAPLEISETNIDGVELLSSSQCLSLIKAFMCIKDTATRRLIMDLVACIADDEESHSRCK